MPQATRFCFWATGKNNFVHMHESLRAGQPGFHGWEPLGFLDHSLENSN